MQGNLTRRRVVAATLATLGTATGVLALSRDKISANADLQMTGLDISDEQTTIIEGEEINDIRISADLEWLFESNVDIHTLQLSLAVGFKEDDAEIISLFERTDMAQQSLTGTTTLEGSVLGSGAFDKSNFQPNGGTITTDVFVIAELLLLRNGDILETAAVSDRAAVEITEESIQITSEVAGTGEITVDSG